MYRGSRKHVLDWVSRPDFLSDLRDLAAPVPIDLTVGAEWMPQSLDRPAEARLESFGPNWLPGSPVWTVLAEWWLKHKAGANTPNWDIAVGCRIEGKPAMVLIEAKANWPELSSAGKALGDKATQNSIDNHAHIKGAIEEANTGWRELDPRVSISRDSHYQLANRLAFTWKLASLGLPIALVYLGFTGDEGIRDAGPPFSDHADWQKAFSGYTAGVFPAQLLERRLNVGPAPVWVLSRSRSVLAMSPSVVA